MHLAVDMIFADAARDKLVILTTEIEYENHLIGDFGVIGNIGQNGFLLCNKQIYISLSIIIA